MRIPVENLETKLIAYHAIASVDVYGWCVFDGLLDVAIVRQAVAALTKEFPVLSSRVVPSWIEPYYETIPNPPPVSVLASPWDSVYQLPEAAVRFFEEKIDLINGPLLKLCYLESKDKHRSFLGLVHTHCLADGRGMVRMFELLAQHYSALVEARPINRPCDRTDRSLRRIYERFSFWENRTLGMVSVRDFARLFLGRRPDHLQGLGAEKQCTLSPSYFIGPQAGRLRRMARRYDVSVGDLLMGAICWAYYRWNRGLSKVRILIPQDLRPYARATLRGHLEDGRWLPIANIVGTFFIDVTAEDLKDKEHLVKTIRRKVQKSFRSHQALAASNYLAYRLSYVPIPLLTGILSSIGSNVIGKAMPVSTCFSNVGRIDARLITFGSVKPLFFSGSLPYLHGLGVVATAVGMRDLVSLTLAHAARGFDVERFHGYIEEFLFKRVKCL